MGIKSGRQTSGNTEYSFNNPPSDFVSKIVEMHSFGGTVPIPRGYMICNGDIINETNYDLIHGLGAYVQDNISTSIILNKNTPNMVNAYSVGAASTPQDGSSAITKVGNNNHQINIQHGHTVNSHTHTITDHVHKIIDYDGTEDADGSGFNSAGASLDFGDNLGSVDAGDDGWVLAITQKQATVTGLRFPDVDLYTDNDIGAVNSGSTSPGTNNQLSATQSIQPSSVEVIKLIRVI